MKSTLTYALIAFAALNLAAMPTSEEMARAEPLVKKLMASEWAALESGTMTRGEVASAAMKLAGLTDTEAAKLLLMKGAFVLYVRDGNLDKAVETMNALETAIADLPPQSVSNMVELALLGASKNEDGARLHRLLAATKPQAVKESGQRQATVDGYTWSYRVKNGEAEIVSEKDGQFSCAVSPNPEGRIVIPSTLGGAKVTRIGENAFLRCKELTALRIPEGVTDICHNAFFECVKLMSVEIPQSLKKLDTGAFIACHVLKSVTLPSGLTSIGDYAFWDCFALTSVTILAKSVGSHAFGVCKGLASVTLSPKVEEIGSDAFCWCGSLKGFDVDSGNMKFTSIDGVLYTKDRKELVVCPGGVESVTVPAFVSKVWDTAFIGCSNLKQINVDDGNQKYTSVDGVLYTKDMSTLVACPGGITTLTIPSGVTGIGNTAFSRNTELTALTMPSSLTNGIGYHAFSSCDKLKSLTIPASLGWGAFDVAKIESVNILSTAKSIGDCAFLHCRQLKEVTIEEGVESIGGCAFAACSSLKSITIPPSVTTIGDGAFKECWRMTTVTMCGERPAAGKDVFDSCPNVAVIHVPANERSWEGLKEWQGKPLVFDAVPEKKVASTAGDKQRVGKNRTTIQSIIDGMIKVPGGEDFWLSETELTQGQWEAVMGSNPSKHKGVDFPVENVSRADCDAFLEKLNQTKEVRSSKFEFCLPGRVEWSGAARAGSGLETKCVPFVKPGVVAENIFDIAWLKENSGGQTHPVAMKVPNAWGFYDMVGNVSEQVIERPGDGCERGYSFTCERRICKPGMFHSISRNRREPCYGLRVAAHLRTDKATVAQSHRRSGSLLTRRNNKSDAEQQQATVDGYAWSYRVNNGEATIEAKKDGKFVCAVSPNPKGHLAIPSTIEGVKVMGIGEHAFFGCGELNSVTIPAGVKNIDNGAFYYCSGLTSISISSSVTDIVPTAFVALHSMKSFSVASDNPSYSSRNGLLCSKDGSVLVAGVNGDVTIPSGVKTIGRQSFLGRGLNMTVTIPSSVTKIEERAFAYCLGLTSVTMLGERPEAPDDVFNNCGQLTAIHVPANAKSWAGMKEWQGKKLVFDEKIDTSGFDHEADPQEAARKAVATLFPGWSLDTEIAPNPRGGFCDSHRGEDNVMYIHPKAEGASAIVSRTMKLSDKNPCLFLKTASWSEDNMDFILSVRVNGKEVMPKRRICTPDFEPWKELTIPLFAWRGRVAKVEVVLTANGWWYEFPFFKRIEIAEGTGQEKFVAEAKETVDGYTWSYRVDNGEATIISEKNGWCSCAVSPEPTGSVSVPATLGGFRVTSIGTSAFLRCKELKSVVIPTGVTSIGWCSFYGCTGLNSVTIPDGVIGIERGAFSLCFRLSSAALPSSVVDIGIDAFTSCGALTSVTIPGGVKVIKGGSFSGCCGLRSLTIPVGVEVIKSGAFSWYCGFKTVSISASVTNIEQGAFIDCKQIESFHVDAANPAYCSKNGLLCSKDGSRLIAGVNGDVTIPEGVTTIGADAFHGCFGLKTATIPSTVTSIELRAFSWIGEQASVCVDERNQSYKSVNGLLLTKDGTTLVHGAKGDVAIPLGVKTIGDTAFCSCGTESVTIPESVDTIERAAFFGCGLKTLTIPSGVRNMGINAFQSCGELTSLTMLGELPNAPLPIFPGCDKLTAIHVPANAKSWEGMKEWQGKPLVFDAK